MPTPTRAEPAIWAGVTVSTTADEYGTGTDCSLREAVKTQNDNANFGGCLRGFDGSPGTDKIFLPSGTYTLTRAGAGEDLDATGDLDIRASVIISTTGAATATVTAAPILGDRVFHILTGTVTIKHMAIRGGRAGSADGGGVLIDSGASLILNDSEVADSFAFGGGGILNNGTAMLTNVTLSGNLASYGGGIYNNGTATLTNVTLSGNSASPTYGGGIFNNGTATLTNVTLSGNSATYGGGINNNGTARLTNVTLSGNSATQSGGGIIISTGNVTLTNTIVANSPSGGNCSGSLGGSFNLSSDGTCGFGAGRDNIAVMLGPLANNGGATLTHLPLPGSPALDFGTDTGCPSTDQRGKPRPVNTCDVGAVERQSSEGILFIFLPLILR